ncbi:hypothetical protein Pan216_33380 [Planctomycetes bacterium Pan216]|uniref:Planctomycete cytochrome C n=1 Tax=Kolteria novifilia TaxID=2527975 RepID=A0A518B666_9BACT|nr:hypothetical protein Pan216_33380 [Planctomycetes bacterium Pan216]
MIERRGRSLLLTALVMLGATAPGRSDDVMASYKKDVEPFLAKYCLDCHLADDPTGGVALDTFTNSLSFSKKGRLLESVADVLGTGLMPPEDMPQPSAQESAAIIAWIERQLSRCDGTSRPGRVTIRRLNRYEYDNTVRDLLGVDLNVSKDFPSDDVGHGFDNIADVLSISPIHTERYLDAAQRIAEAAIAVPDETSAPRRVYSAEKLQHGQMNSGVRLLASNGAIHVDHEFPEEGEYLLEATAYGDQAGTEPVRASLKLDGAELVVHDVTATRGTPDIYRTRQFVSKGRHRIAVTFLNDYWDAKAPDGEKDRNLWVESLRIVGPLLPHPVVRKEATDLEGGHLHDNRARRLPSTGTVTATFNIPADGLYAIRVRAHADQAGKDLARLAIQVNEKTIAEPEVPAEKENPDYYVTKRKLKAGKTKIGAAFLNDFYDPKASDPTRRDRNLIIHSIELQGPLGTPTSSEQPLIVRRPELQESSWEECARESLKPLLSRAFRRPVREDELRAFTGLVEQARVHGESFDGAMQLALQATLVSPNFLFRIEKDPPEGKVRLLDEYELATRLSYFLWSSMPDEELFEQARNSTLRKNLPSQIKRMLADPKADALVENFAGQWLHTRLLANVTPDTKVFPKFNEKLREAMRQETELFFASVMREDRSILDLLDADYTFLNERLAKHYGIDGVKGDQFRRVSMNGDRRGGVLTHASILTVTSNPNRTSPVKRGKWILEQLLGTPPPEPPPQVPELDESTDVVLSAPLRVRLEQHRAKAECAACHRRMDPLGFALENYDAIGGWRERDGKFPIDPSGTLPGGKLFEGPKDLRALLRSSPEKFTRNLIRQMLAYGLGRGVEYYDRCAINRIEDRLQSGDYAFSRLVLGIVESDPFQMRSAEGGEE